MLRKNQDMFAHNLKDNNGVVCTSVEHRLGMTPGAHPIRQKMCLLSGPKGGKRETKKLQSYSRLGLSAWSVTLAFMVVEHSYGQKGGLDVADVR